MVDDALLAVDTLSWLLWAWLCAVGGEELFVGRWLVVTALGGGVVGGGGVRAAASV